MEISERIDFDLQRLYTYFHLLFTMADTASQKAPLPVEVNQKPGLLIPHTISEFIRPDMVCNIYSLLDFWLSELCRFHQLKCNLIIGRKDIKGDDDLDA